jgi:hypothetical protein
MNKHEYLNKQLLSRSLIQCCKGVLKNQAVYLLKNFFLSWSFSLYFACSSWLCIKKRHAWSPHIHSSVNGRLIAVVSGFHAGATGGRDGLKHAVYE